MIEVRNDDRHQLDEVVCRGCYVHLERMDEHWFCLIVEDGTRRLLINVGTPDTYRRKVNATIYADEIPSAASQPDERPLKWDRECVRCGHKWRESDLTDECPKCATSQTSERQDKP